MAEASSRLDRWLWCARIVKTRSLARDMIHAGHVRLNRRKVLKPGHEVKPGDVLTIAWAARVFVWRVTAIPQRRGSAAEARRIYEDVSAVSRKA
jgi:ribosome-associated heat shock protein Hsp15